MRGASCGARLLRSSAIRLFLSWSTFSNPVGRATVPEGSGRLTTAILQTVGRIEATTKAARIEYVRQPSSLPINSLINDLLARFARGARRGSATVGEPSRGLGLLATEG